MRNSTATLYIFEGRVMINRHVWLDYLRAIAAMLVVLLHTAAPYLYKYNNIDLSSWNVGNYVDSFTRISVPLFFMISGFLFFREKSPKLKHFIRIIAALFFYSALCLLYIKFYRGGSISDLAKDILFKPVFYHLWFFYTITLIYLLAIFFTIRQVKLSHALILFFITFVVLNPQLAKLTNFLDYTYVSRLRLDGNLLYFLLYAVFGAILGNTIEIKNIYRWANIAPIIYVITSLLIGYGTYVLSVDANRFVSTMYSYNGVLVSLGAISVFIFIRAYHEKLSPLSAPLNIISQNSLAIYGVHALILDYIARSGYRNYNNPLADILLVFSVTLILSLVIGVIIKRFDKKNLVT